MITSYKQLTVWQKSMQLCELTYLCTKYFPRTEMYGLTAQIRKCSISIPSNIAEGFMRGHGAEHKQFLRIAYGSGAELETQFLIALRIGYLKKDDYEKVNALLEEIMKMLNRLISKY